MRKAQTNQPPDRTWELVHAVLDRFDAASDTEVLCAALDSLLFEELSIDRAVLFWKGAGHRNLKLIPFRLGPDIDTESVEERLELFRSVPAGLFRSVIRRQPEPNPILEALGELPESLEESSLQDLPGEEFDYRYVRAGDGLEVVLFWRASMEIPAPQLLLALRAFALRWSKLQADRDLARVGLQLSRIRAVSEELGRQLEFKPLLSRILKMTISLVDAQKGFIMIVNDKTGNLRTEVVHGLPNPLAEEAINRGERTLDEIPPGKGIQGHVLLSRKPIMMDQQSEFRGTGLEPDINSIICVPLQMNGEVFGVIYVTNKRETVRFGKQDLDMVCILASAVSSVVDQTRLYQKTVTDHLTSLYTRRFLEPRLDQEVRRSLRYRTQVSILAIDADHFKQVNDTWGHAAGDQALKTLAETINGSIRTGVDLPGRMGGEEFCVLLPETPLAGAKVVAERIRANMESAIIQVDESHTVQLTVSIGAAACPEHAMDSETLMRRADEALYHSKETGRNRVTLWSPDLKG